MGKLGGGGRGRLESPDAEGVVGDLVPIPLPIWDANSYVNA